MIRTPTRTSRSTSTQTGAVRTTGHRRTAAGEWATARRRARISAARRPPSSMLPSVDRTGVAPCADRGADLRRDQFRMGPLACLACAVSLSIAAVLASISVLSAAAGPPTEVTVGSGDTLWAIAQRSAPDVDPRAELEQIKLLNALHGDSITPGMVLEMPTQGG